MGSEGGVEIGEKGLDKGGAGREGVGEGKQREEGGVGGGEGREIGPIMMQMLQRCGIRVEDWQRRRKSHEFGRF